MITSGSKTKKKSTIFKTWNDDAQKSKHKIVFLDKYNKINNPVNGLIDLSSDLRLNITSLWYQ